MFWMTALLCGQASAYTYWGNPSLTITVERAEADLVDGSGWLDAVLVHHCDGTTDTYTVDALVDPVAGYSLTVAGGDLCSVEPLWGGDIAVSGDGFELASSAISTWIPLSGASQCVSWIPFTIVTGAITGSAPLACASLL